MKVKINADRNKLEEIIKRLKNEAITHSNEDYDLVITDPSFQKREIIGKNEKSEFIIIKPAHIIYVESFGHELFCHTKQGKLSIKEKLYEVEAVFENEGFIRVHKSYVVNKNHIDAIKPTFNTKFILRMSNKDVIEVSRNFYNIFKSRIGL